MTDTTPTGATPEPRRRAPHFVSQEPWDPYVADKLTAEQERYYMAGQWKLMWWRFRRHKPAVVSLAFLLLMYFSTLISEFIAPYDLHTRHTRYIFAAPQSVHLFHEGSFLGPFVYGLKMERDPATLQRVYSPDKTKPQQLRFFCLGESYEFWGLIEGSFHFVCPPKDGTFFLLGTDRLGRDMFSRIVYAARISLTIGIIGIALSFALALILGGLAGYYGGWIDSVVQRITEIIKSFPHLPLWLALSAALPSPGRRCWSISASPSSWRCSTGRPGTRRPLQAPVAARGGLRCGGTDDGRQARAHHRPPPAARLHESPDRVGHPVDSVDDPGRDGAVVPRPRTAASHHLMGRAAERGDGHQRRAVNWWLMLPVVPVILVILAYQFMGDGMRDAADPYA